MNVYINKSDNSSAVKWESQEKEGSITIPVNEKGECFFENGVLKYSPACNEINGIEKSTKKNCSYGSGYLVVSKEKSDTFCGIFNSITL